MNEFQCDNDMMIIQCVRMSHGVYLTIDIRIQLQRVVEYELMERC